MKSLNLSSPKTVPWRQGLHGGISRNSWINLEKELLHCSLFSSVNRSKWIRSPKSILFHHKNKASGRVIDLTSPQKLLPQFVTKWSKFTNCAPANLSRFDSCNTLAETNLIGMFIYLLMRLRQNHRELTLSFYFFVSDKMQGKRKLAIVAESRVNVSQH